MSTHAHATVCGPVYVNGAQAPLQVQKDCGGSITVPGSINAGGCPKGMSPSACTKYLDFTVGLSVPGQTFCSTAYLNNEEPAKAGVTCMSDPGIYLTAYGPGGYGTKGILYGTSFVSGGWCGGKYYNCAEARSQPSLLGLGANPKFYPATFTLYIVVTLPGVFYAVAHTTVHNLAYKGGGGTVTGTIHYEYLSGPGYAKGDPSSSTATLTPARETEVEILGASKSACTSTVLSTVFTADDGTYTSETIKPSEKYFCVKVVAATKYSTVLPYSGGNSGDAYASDAQGPKELSTSGSTTFKWKPTSGSDSIDQALDIDNAVLTGSQWLHLYGVTPPLLKILYPFPTTQGVSNFSSSGVNINLDDAFDWGVLFHEYGHYVASLIGLNNTTSVRDNQHDLSSNMTNIEGVKNQGVAIAWNEGFAGFFSQMVQKAMDTGSLGLPDVGGSPPIYIDHTPRSTLKLQLDSPGSAPPTPSRGEDNEVSVARVLWDLYSQPKYAGASGSVTFIKTLADSMTSNERRNLSQSVGALERAQRAEPWVPDLGHSTAVEVPVHYNEATAVTVFGTVLSDQNVAPTISDIETTSSGNGVDVKFSSGQPMGAKDRLNLFAVQIWDHGWTTLLREQVEDSTELTHSIANGTTIYKMEIPVSTRWPPGELHAVVVGWNTQVAPAGLTITNLLSILRSSGGDPLTGPYVSALAGFTVRQH